LQHNLHQLLSPILTSLGA